MDRLQSFLLQTKGGISLIVKARPGSSRSREIKIVDIGEGRQALEVTVSAAAVDGKANEAIVSALADALRVKKSAVHIKAGHKGRLKTIEIAGSAEDLIKCLKESLGGTDE